MMFVSSLLDVKRGRVHANKVERGQTTLNEFARASTTIDSRSFMICSTTVLGSIGSIGALSRLFVHAPFVTIRVPTMSELRRPVTALAMLVEARKHLQALQVLVVW